jgi:hypothetical protein
MDERTQQSIESGFPGSSWALWSEDFPATGCIEEDTAQHRN